LGFAEGRMKKKSPRASESASTWAWAALFFADGRVEHPVLESMAGKRDCYLCLIREPTFYIFK